MRSSLKLLISLVMVWMLSISIAFAQADYYEIKEQQLSGDLVQGKYPIVQVDNILLKSKINGKINKIVNDFQQDIQNANSTGTETTGFISYEIKANNENTSSAP